MFFFATSTIFGLFMTKNIRKICIQQNIIRIFRVREKSSFSSCGANKKSRPILAWKTWNRAAHINNPRRGHLMSEKYHIPAEAPRIVTNDRVLAAYLLSEGCELDRLVKNARRRVSFVFAGEKARRLREAYRAGVVRLQVHSFRESLVTVRRKMAETKRSAPCPESRMRLSRA
jgi:hypothetical protein